MWVDDLPGPVFGALHEYSWRYWRWYLAGIVLLGAAATGSAWWTTLVLLLLVDPPVRADWTCFWHCWLSTLSHTSYPFPFVPGVLVYWQRRHLLLGCGEDALARHSHDDAHDVVGSASSGACTSHRSQLREKSIGACYGS